MIPNPKISGPETLMNTGYGCYWENFPPSPFITQCRVVKLSVVHRVDGYEVRSQKSSSG